jgi:hypothetical protein
VPVSVAEYCVLVSSSIAMSEVGAEVAGSAAGAAGDSAISLVMGVSRLANIATGILVLKPAKLKDNGGNS